METISHLEPQQQKAAIHAKIAAEEKLCEQIDNKHGLYFIDKLNEFLADVELEAYQDILALEARATQENQAELFILYLRQDIINARQPYDILHYLVNSFDLFFNLSAAAQFRTVTAQ